MVNPQKDTNNYYEIIYNLKQLRQESQNLKTIQEWEIFISKFLSFIFSNEFLKDKFTTSVNSYLSVNQSENNFTQDFINQYIVSSNLEFNLSKYWHSILYLEPKMSDIHSQTKEYFNIFDFYMDILNSNFNIEFYTKYQTLIETIDCFILSFLNIHSLPFDNETIFSKLYLNAVFNGVYNRLTGFLNQETAKYYTEEYKQQQEITNIEIDTRIKLDFENHLEIKQFTLEEKNICNLIVNNYDTPQILEIKKVGRSGLNSQFRSIVNKLIDSEVLPKGTQKGYTTIKKFFEDNPKYKIVQNVL